MRESVTLVTALNPIIGYEKAALIAKLLDSDCRGSDVLFSTRILKKSGLRI